MAYSRCRDTIVYAYMNRRAAVAGPRFSSTRRPTGNLMNVTTQVPSRARVAPRALALATKGAGSNDEDRLRRLLALLECEFFPFDPSRKRQTFFALLKRLRDRDGRIAVMEGTGVAGGLALILAAALWGRGYIVSSGDAVAPFLSALWPWGRPLFWLYEKALYSFSRGFIGWTPYLAGRALTMGAPRAMTAPGFAPFPSGAHAGVREEFGIPRNAIVFGLAGALVWSRRYRYCYGLETVDAALTLPPGTVCVLIVGDGTGLAELRRRAGSRLGVDIFLPGRVEQRRIPGFLAAMDIGLLPQSVDSVGSFRYTTKVAEYLAAKLPFVTNEIPAAYDLFSDFCWILPGRSPWDPRFVVALARLMQNLSYEDVKRMRGRIPESLREFDAERQTLSVSRFLTDACSP
jgi:hypothetical protein